MGIEKNIPQLVGRSASILKELDTGLLRLGGTGSTVGSILSWLQRDRLTHAETMQVLEQLRETGHLPQFLNLISHRDLRRYLREQGVSWTFIQQHWEPSARDSTALLAGVMAGVGEDAVEALQLIYIHIGSLKSKELAQQRNEFWEGVNLFLNSPMVTLERTIVAMLQEVEQHYWNLQFFEVGRAVGRIALAILALPSAIRKLPALLRKAEALMARAAQLTLKQLRELGISLELLRSLATSPNRYVTTPNGMIVFMSADDYNFLSKNGSPLGKISQKKIDSANRPSKPKVKGLRRVEASTEDWLRKEGLWQKAKQSLSKAGDDVIDAINAFHGQQGFRQVVASYLSNSRNAKDGARFVMRFANDRLSANSRMKAISFEMRSLSDRRKVDIFADGIRYELKSVREVDRRFVSGRKRKNGTRDFGELVKDIIIGIDSSGFDRLRKTKWIFDGSKISLTKEQIAKRLQEMLAKDPLVGKSYPRFKELKEIVGEMIEVWPPKK